MKNFFISYNKADRQWAEWIAWVLEEEGFTTVLQAWDFRPGSNFVQQMQQAATEAKRTIAVLSPDYLGALYTHPEWQAAFAQDPTGERGILLPVRVRECKVTGLLAQIISIDLVGLDEQTALETLHRGIKLGRGKPPVKPPFPDQLERSVPKHPQFPGTTDSQQAPDEEGAQSISGASLKRFHDSAPLASWVFGGLILLFLMLIVFVEIDPSKFPILRFLMALSAAFLALFFVGGVLLQGTLKGLYISATGGFVLFILIQFVFNPFEVLPNITQGGEPSDSITVNLPNGLKFQSAARFLAELDGFSVGFGVNCDESFKGAEVNGGSLMGKGTLELIKGLRHRLKDPKLGSDYEVTKKQEDGVYEIRCSR